MERLEDRKLLTVATLTVNSLRGGSFEAPALAAQAYQSAPASSPWQFSGAAGVSSNGSGFTVGNPNAPDGTQVALIKNNGSINQTVYLEAGVYELSFVAAQRLNYQSQNQQLEILVDGAEAGVVVPADTTYAPYQSANFTVAAGTHTVKVRGMSPQAADSTAFLDQATIAPVVDAFIGGDFERPALAAATFQTDPSGQAWQFSGTAGVASNNSGFLANATVTQTAPAGTQVAFIQDAGSISQTVYLHTGAYQVSFQAAQRAFNQSNYQEIEVLVDGSQYGVINPVGAQFASYQSSTFTVAAGAHSIEFLGLNPEGGNNTAFIDQASIAAVSPISNANFEAPAIDAGQYQFAPTGASWQFSGAAGVSTNGSDFTSGNSGAPDGAQVAFIKDNGGMSQSVTLAAGSYCLSFQAAQRGNGSSQSQEIEVLVDGTEVGAINPVGAGYISYVTPNFTVAAGTHNIQLLGMNPQGGDSTALIDLVTLTAVQNQIIDGGFETPVLAATIYQVAPSGTSWQFSGLAGVSTNGSPLSTGSANAPQGAQAGFIMNNGSMSYSACLDAGTYSVSFLAAQRATYQNQNQQIQVLVDGEQAALITPSGTSYSPYETSNFTVAAGTHAIQFRGMTGPNAGSTALLDQVSISAAQDTFSDGGFETPVLAAKAYAAQPGGSAWRFSGSAGMTANGSGFTGGSANAPGGAQAAFVKNTGSMSQAVYFDAGTYNISFQAAQRTGYYGQTIAVSVDSQQVGVITPVGITYLLYQTSNFNVTTGTHNVQFVGMTPASGDSTAFIDNATITAGSVINDGSFEAPGLAAGTYQPAPGGTAWQYAGAAGVSTNQSAFTVGNPNAPDGAQVAFIKETGSMGQTLYMAGGIYNISFMAAQRAQHQSQSESLQILVDGQQVGSATPSSTTYGLYQTSTFTVPYGLYQTSTFTVASGMHTIRFVGVNPAGGDNTVFIDQVQLNA